MLCEAGSQCLGGGCTYLRELTAVQSSLTHLTDAPVQQQLWSAFRSASKARLAANRSCSTVQSWH